MPCPATPRHLGPLRPGPRCRQRSGRRRRRCLLLRGPATTPTHDNRRDQRDGTDDQHPRRSSSVDPFARRLPVRRAQVEQLHVGKNEGHDPEPGTRSQARAVRRPRVGRRCMSRAHGRAATARMTWRGGTAGLATGRTAPRRHARRELPSTTDPSSRSNGHGTRHATLLGLFALDRFRLNPATGGHRAHRRAMGAAREARGGAT